MKKAYELLEELNKKFETLSPDHIGCMLNFDLESASMAGCYWTFFKTISINGSIYRQAGFELMREVIIHEYSHYAVDILYSEKVADHGREWKEMMRFFGVEKPRAKSDPRLYRYKKLDSDVLAKCGCGELYLSIRIANKIRKGNSRYRCHTCGKRVEIVL